ncbi:hypothetical protein CDD83_5502 [Cordyceps sp. RAO-2017]|nr:hypothetical protein CDD83_5502 [Cordyceps sp. RAO-2017]
MRRPSATPPPNVAAQGDKALARPRLPGQRSPPPSQWPSTPTNLPPVCPDGGDGLGSHEEPLMSDSVENQARLVNARRPLASPCRWSIRPFVHPWVSCCLAATDPPLAAACAASNPHSIPSALLSSLSPSPPGLFRERSLFFGRQAPLLIDTTPSVPLHRRPVSDRQDEGQGRRPGR